MQMTADRRTRQPGTPVGELLARPSPQRASLSNKSSPSPSPGMPLAIFYSDSDSDLAYVASSSSPEQGEKPKPSAAPHLQWTTAAIKPSDLAGLSLPKAEFGEQTSLSLPNEDFGGQINFDFCKQQPQLAAHSVTSLTQSSQPKSRACKGCGFFFRLVGLEKSWRSKKRCAAAENKKDQSCSLERDLIQHPFPVNAKTPQREFELDSLSFFGFQWTSKIWSRRHCNLDVCSTLEAN